MKFLPTIILYTLTSFAAAKCEDPNDRTGRCDLKNEYICRPAYDGKKYNNCLPKARAKCDQWCPNMCNGAPAWDGQANNARVENREEYDGQRREAAEVQRLVDYLLDDAVRLSSFWKSMLDVERARFSGAEYMRPEETKAVMYRAVDPFHPYGGLMSTLITFVPTHNSRDHGR
ncbi:hypothetical protein Slin15195_G117970 [Septoria linicola]|uniref:ShKT domain-containing protein n=1 Tax=Septoria linicola TaxID=215465 RepID=A0A9Q9B3W7_9PEZI|nr:hypothetical protein Slin15195_G117970 [Septoria linicola]